MINPDSDQAKVPVAAVDNCRKLIFDSFKVMIVDRLDQNDAGVRITEFVCFHLHRSFPIMVAYLRNIFCRSGLFSFLGSIPFLRKKR